MPSTKHVSLPELLDSPSQVDKVGCSDGHLIEEDFGLDVTDSGLDGCDRIGHGDCKCYAGLGGRRSPRRYTLGTPGGARVQRVFFFIL